MPKATDLGSEKKQDKRVVLRYAPSPTGIPHIGNIRTALFNFLLARSQGGKFLLRIEDTDRARIIPQAVEKIKESLQLLGLFWDGKEIIQSSRLEIYQKHLEALKQKDLAYKDDGAWRFKVTKGKTIAWQDGLHGEISFKSDILEDFIIVKSDGYPTYHFASVVDDHLMQVSHTLRGDEWIPSTPKHILIYEALGWQSPKFIHVPPILNTDHKKLSKRDGAKSVIEYIDEGYLPEAIVNFLAFLGWAPKDSRELFSLEDLIKEFSLNRINKNSPIFNLEKLQWFNGQWIRKSSDQNLAKKITKREKKYTFEKVVDLIPLVKDRMTNLDDFEKIAGFILEDKIKINPNKIVLDAGKLKLFEEKFKAIGTGNWTKTTISSAVTSIMDAENLTKSEALGSIGTAVSGSNITPPLFDSLEKLGYAKTIKRLKDAIEKKK